MSVKNGTIAINTRSEDSSQVANILYKPEIISVEGAKENDKYGIHNLIEFISVLTLSDLNTLDIDVLNNTLIINYGDKAKIEYFLSDLNLITEGPTELKAKIEFPASFNITPDFIKKVKNISNTIKANLIKVSGVGGDLSYSILNKSSQTHSYTEKISEDKNPDIKDFEVIISIKDDMRDNFGFLFEDCNYEFSINPKIIKLEGITEEYGMLRYYIKPLA